MDSPADTPTTSTTPATEAIPEQRATGVESPETPAPAPPPAAAAPVPAPAGRSKLLIAGAGTAGVVLVGLGVGAGVVLADNSSDISRLQDRVAVLQSEQAALTDRTQSLQNSLIQQESAFGFSREHLSRASGTVAGG